MRYAHLMMSAYLLTWNPAKYDWATTEITNYAKQSASGVGPTFHWSCSHSKKPARGDRVFLMKLGKHGRGIFASGWMTRGSYPAAREADFGPQRVDVEWDVFLDPRLDASRLDPTVLTGEQHWTPEMSGTSIKPKVRDGLEMLWAGHLRDLERSGSPRSFTDEELRDSFELEALEGELVQRLVIHRRRERSLRDAKLVDHRRIHSSLKCEVCKYDFRKEFGVEYAEVHHVKPLSITGPTITKLSDLAVLCANCHRVAHLEPKRPKSLAQLRAMRSVRP